MGIVLRPYQAELKAKVYKAWCDGHKNSLLVMPTGMGKTRTFCSIAEDLAINGSVPEICRGQKLPTSIMVHRKELVSQISLTLAEVGIHHNIICPPEDIREMIGLHRTQFGKQFYHYDANVTVLSVDTLNKRIGHHEKWTEKIKVWITDEATHLLKENKWGKSVSYFPNAIGLGVTATPERLDKRGLGRHADGVFDVMIEGPTSKWGIEMGFLCNYKVVLPRSDYLDHLVAAREGADFTKQAMVAASSQSHILGDVVENYIKFALNTQAIVFADSIETAHKMEKGFQSRGINAKTLTGETERRERFQAMRDFRDRRIKVLINVDLFDEGLDVPGIETVIMARPTMSLGKYLQMVGRGLRPAPGKEHLVLIDHVGNVERHGLPDKRRRWTLDRIIRRRGSVSLIRICQNIACNSPFDRVLTECPYCGEEFRPSGGGGGGVREALKQVDGDLVLLDPEQLRELLDGTVLEDPAEVAKRVSSVAGGAAGLHAMQAQRERIETQKILSEVIATWAGRMKFYNYTDRQIHKQFYLKFGQTITEALSEPRAEMIRSIELIEDDE